MQIDYSFLASALTLISNGALQQVGRTAIDNGFKAVQPFVQSIWAFVQNKSQEETIAELKNNAAIKVLVEELAKLIEANPEFKTALQEAIESGKYTIGKQVNVSQSGTLNTQKNTITL